MKKRIYTKIYIYTHRAESLYYTLETNTTLYINDIPIKLFISSFEKRNIPLNLNPPSPINLDYRLMDFLKVSIM